MALEMLMFTGNSSGEFVLNGPPVDDGTAELLRGAFQFSSFLVCVVRPTFTIMCLHVCVR